MTIDDILEQAKALTAQERAELARRLLDIPHESQSHHEPKTGAEIVAMLEAMEEPIELVDPHIEDPVEWVKAQRRKEQERLRPYWDGEA